MKYTLETTPRFDREFKKLDKNTQKLIKGWITKNLEETENPREQGHDLKGNFKGLWRYRVGNYRIISQIQDNKLVILALSVGHRKEIYKEDLPKKYKK